MSNGIGQHIIEEGNLRAVKDTGDFGGSNMWQLFIKDTTGWFRDVQWMSVDNVQPFFKQTLPCYQQTENNKYKIKE
jgi:hypothetical protein